MTGEPEGPRLARTVPTSVNELPRVEASGTEITTDVHARAVTVLAPVKRSVANALRALRGRRRMHVLDDGVALPDIRAAEAVGADWCVWSRGAFAGCRIETTVAVALGVCTAVGDTTISGLDW